jgi:hypothetical protein
MKRNTLFFACLLFALTPLVVFAQGSDNAFDAVYDDGWDNGDNGGSGFGAWQGLDNIVGWSEHEISSSDLGLESWKFWAHTSNTSDGYRTFNTTPSALDRITIQMDNGSIQNGGTVGLALENSSGNYLLEIYFIGGESFYTVNGEGNSVQTTLGWTSTGIDIQIDILADDAFSVKLTNINSSQNSTILGTLNGSTESINRIRFFNYNAGYDPSYNLYFNNLSHEIGVVLPLQWLSFSAEKHDQQVALSWSYEGSEVDKFIVERAGEEQHFSQLSGEIRGDLELRSNTMHFTDHSPMAGVNYYRIKAVDQNGGISYSTLRKVRMQKDEQVLFYPNPVRDYITIPAALESLSMIKIFDFSGKLCYQNKFLGKTNTQVDLSSLENGEYKLLFLFENGRKESRSLYKVK